MSRKEKLLHEQQEKVVEMQRKKIIEVQNVSMRFRLTDDKIMSLKEFVTRKLSGKYISRNLQPNCCTLHWCRAIAARSHARGRTGCSPMTARPRCLWS